MKKIYYIVCALFSFLLFSTSIFANHSLKVIKVAILDNFHFQPNIKDTYDQYYLSGIDLAKHVFYKNGYIINYKLFSYSRDPTDILNTLPQIKKWNPDVVIGPRNSNMFLMTKDYFKNILVISPFATSMLVEKMSKNYYSLALPDSYVARAILKFTNRKFPHKEIFCITQIDCKNCVDLSNIFKKEYESLHPDKILQINNFLQDDVLALDVKSILNGYRNNQLIFLPNESYASAVLMVRIVNFLKHPVVFVGADDWGNQENSELGKLKLKSQFPYIAYHITPLSMDLKDVKIQNFIKKYKSRYKKMPNDVSYLSYNSIDSIISAINRYPDRPDKNMRDLILSSYMDILKKYPNWFRLTKYAVYKITPGKEIYLNSINVDYLRGKRRDCKFSNEC